jgi:hypothetical protein
VPSKPKSEDVRRGLPDKSFDTVGSSGKSKSSSDEGAKARPIYHHRDEEYVLVTRDDLREVKGLGWLQQSLFGVGTFLFSGAFWLFWSLIAEQTKFDFTAWMGMCVISMIAGLAVAAVGLTLFALRQKRLNKYFPTNDPPTVS